jgi:hypothetical protein
MCILGFSNKYGLTITYELISLHIVNKDCAPMLLTVSTFFIYYDQVIKLMDKDDSGFVD